MSKPLNIIIVEKDGNLKILSIKDFKLEDLYKKCGFKKSNDFLKQVDWNAKYNGEKYFIEVYAKTDGRANSENKFDFPPPIDKKLFFGSCAILAYFKKEDGFKNYTDLSLPLWNKIYEKLFGGFEDLVTTALEDEEEIDELLNIPKEKKTKQGYLKDGFVIDSSDADESCSQSESDIFDKELAESEEESNEVNAEESDILLEDLGSELSEESYDYDSEINKK